MPKPLTKSVAERRVFVSYSHDDIEGVRVLLKWLRPLCARLPGANAVWVDYEQLKGGDEWNPKILQAIEAANVFIVVMSISYVDSKFCIPEELQRIMAKRQAGQADVIGIALRKVPLANFNITLADGSPTGLAQVQCLPQSDVAENGSSHLGLRSIDTWLLSARDVAWDLLAGQLESAMNKTATAPLAPLPTSDTQPLPSPPLPPGPRLAAHWLPYLANRDDQCMALNESLARWTQTACRRPLVVLTEGRSEDCLWKWIERLQEMELARGLGLDAQGPSFGNYKSFAWPLAAGVQTTPEDAGQIFQRAIANAIGPLPTASQQAMWAAYLDRQRPTLLWVSCADRLDPAQARCALQGLLHLLAQWPGLSPANMLVVAVNLDRGTRQAGGERAKLADVFLPTLQQAQDRQHIQLAVLGSLPELDYSHIARWAQDHAAHCLSDDIEMLHDTLPTNDCATWPMLTFAKHARAWITGP